MLIDKTAEYMKLPSKRNREAAELRDDINMLKESIFTTKLNKHILEKVFKNITNLMDEIIIDAVGDIDEGETVSVGAEVDNEIVNHKLKQLIEKYVK
jgi:hypothetical protein